jgi:hypothetical protein
VGLSFPHFLCWYTNSTHTNTHTHILNTHTKHTKHTLNTLNTHTTHTKHTLKMCWIILKSIWQLKKTIFFFQVKHDTYKLTRIGITPNSAPLSYSTLGSNIFTPFNPLLNQKQWMFIQNLLSSLSLPFFCRWRARYDICYIQIDQLVVQNSTFQFQCFRFVNAFVSLRSLSYHKPNTTSSTKHHIHWFNE